MQQNPYPHKPGVTEDQPLKEVMEWILNGTSATYDEQVKPGRKSLVTLCCATLFMSLMSAAANYVTLVRLIRTKVKNITLLTMKSCTAAEIVSTVMFIVFVSPAWFTGKVIYSAVTCSAEGFFQAWAQLSIYAGLVFILIQRYVLAHKMSGYKIFRDRHRLCVAMVWFVTGVISSSPLIYSLGIYVHNKSLSHCVLDSHTVRFLFDTLSLFVPAVFMIVAAFINGQANQHLQKRGIRSLPRDGNSNSRDALAPISVTQPCDLDAYSLAMAGEVTMGVLAAATLNSSMTGIETTLALIAVAYITALWTLAIFGLRTYGTWAGNNFSIPLATTHLLCFCSSFTRAVIFLMVDRLARPYMRERGFLDDAQPSSAYSTDLYQSLTRPRTQNNTSTSDTKVRASGDSQGKSSAYIPVTLPPIHTAHSIQEGGLTAFWSNKPCELITSSQMLNIFAEPAAVRSRLLLYDGPRSADLSEDQSISNGNDEGLTKRSKQKASEGRRIYRDKTEQKQYKHTVPFLETFDYEEGRFQDKEPEPCVLLPSPTKRKENMTKGNFVWLNRLNSTESEGVTIYDRFRIEKKSHRMNKLPVGLSNRANKVQVSEAKRCQRSSADTGFVIRVSNGETCTTSRAAVKKRRQFAKSNKPQNEMSCDQSRRSGATEMTTSLSGRGERRTSGEEGTSHSLKKDHVYE
ncbi:hypothetical protein ElyMa_001916600 [Elysia marginata]|uniref:G-protein coupled receptors family 1 profile domain-containing protein n=1 Tax=Elysia marginata TaxID=1093978 RepID=A0AAV4EUE2_9GAST|nr:hypothetical protein ElyMa_001916600 [Elysia marginata]